MNKYILIYSLFILTACTTNIQSHVVEPLDVVVSQQANRLELGDHAESIDVTRAKVVTCVSCSQHSRIISIE